MHIVGCNNFKAAFFYLKWTCDAPSVFHCGYVMVCRGGKWRRTVVSHLCSAKVSVWFTSAVFNAGILLGTKFGRKSWGKTDLFVYWRKYGTYEKILGSLTGLHISPLLRKDCSWTNTSFLKAYYSMLWTEVMAVGNLNSAGVLLPAGKILTEVDIESTSGGWSNKPVCVLLPSYSEDKTTSKGFALN